MRPIIDSHLDLAWNALYFDRNLLLDVAEVRRSEAGLTDEPAQGRNAVTLPELRRARMTVCLATLLARSGPDRPPRAQSKRMDLDYNSQAVAYAHARGQLAYYRLLEQQDHLRFVRTRAELKAHWQAWSRSPETQPPGIILSMEGADPIVNPDQVQAWWEDGLRVVGPVHYGRSQYACGTSADGPISDRGVALLKEFMRVGMILDVTHLSDRSLAQALEIYSGPVLASHHNCRALVPGDRQLADEQIRALIQRNAVIGTAFDAWMLHPGWKRGETDRKVVGTEAAAAHIDHICQLAGSIHHCALGTDLDGGFGTEQTPRDLDTYRDLHKLEAILGSRGYRPKDIDAVFYGNWLRFFSAALPAEPGADDAGRDTGAHVLPQEGPV
jgi:membrane dipeptidase